MKTVRTAPLARRLVLVGRETLSRKVEWSYTAVFGAACLLYALVHVATIVQSRRVWFDETFFSSVADSLVQTGEFCLSVCPLWLQKPVYLYGPVYFLIVGSVFKLFGVGIVQNRLPGLLFGFTLLPVTFLILRHEKVRSGIALTICALLALDPTFHQGMHSGRMESTALFFFLAGFFFLLKSRDAGGRAGIGWCFASGTSSALAVLTTPRPGYMLIPMGLILLARYYRRRDVSAFLQALVWSIAFVCLYGIWILYAFGSIDALTSYYSSFVDASVGGSQVRLAHVPLLSLICAFLLLTLVHAPRRIFTELTAFTTLGVAGYYVFVKDGPMGALYTFLMIPPAYMALASLMSGWSEQRIDERRKRLIQYGAFGLLFLVNGSAFMARGALELAEWQRRDPQSAYDAIRKVVPSGSRVVGDDQFYFAVKGSGSDFQYIERGGTLPERVAYHRDVFQFDYLITSRDDDSEIVRGYMAEVPMRKIAEIGGPPTTRLGEAIVGIGRALGLSNSLMSGYQATVFARAR